MFYKLKILIFESKKKAYEIMAITWQLTPNTHQKHIKSFGESDYRLVRCPIKTQAYYNIEHDITVNIDCRVTSLCNTRGFPRIIEF